MSTPTAATGHLRMEADEAVALLASAWGLEAQVSERGSSEAQVFDVRTAEGTRAALKVHRPGDERGFLRAQAAVTEHLATVRPDLATPREIGQHVGGLQLPDGRTAVLTTWVPGRVLGELSHLPPELVRELGGVAGRVCSALAGIELVDPAAGVHRVSAWDPRHARATLRRVLGRVPERWRGQVDRALDRLEGSGPTTDAPELPQQLAHTDITDWNVLGSRTDDGLVGIDGVIDFGDLVHTWRLCEVAAPAHAAASRQQQDPLGAVLEVVRGFCVAAPLSEDEAQNLWWTVLARAALCVALEAVEAVAVSGNHYLDRLVDTDGATLTALLEVDPRVATAAVRVAAGHLALPGNRLANLPGGASGDEAPDPLRGPAPCRVVAGVEPRDVLTRWGDTVVVPDPDDRVPDPLALALYDEIAVAGRVPVHAPWAAVVRAVEQQWLQLTCRPTGLDAGGELLVTLTGLSACVQVGQDVEAGQRIGVVREPTTGPGVLRIQLGAGPGLPERGRTRDRQALTALCPDPAALSGLPTHPVRTGASGAARGRYVAAAQTLYYAEPTTIVRGRGQWLWDSTGRRLLDVVNNVAAVGHAHPAVTAAATEQFSLHNTNSRFLYEAMDEYAELLATVLPPDLRCLFFVNSGSEAVDLGLQLARAHTGRRAVVALENAYHGWTTDAWELATMPGDRPEWRRTLSPDVRIAQTPDPYRGEHGNEVGGYLDSLRRQLEDLEPRGGAAAFISEPLLGSQGGVRPVPGYLQRAYTSVREAGGVTIADEIQVGFARTGQTFWAFEAEGVVPDVLVAAKAVGNGHPLGFVACRPQIAASFAAARSFFSSPGGGPVSCRVGTAVLRAVLDEGLQENARVVGAHLHRRLLDLADRTPYIGAVHGRGLYQGVDLVTGDGSRRPLPGAAVREVAERLRRLGVISQPTGVHSNVLKVKPPLCLETADADLFVDQLERALIELGELPATREDHHRPRDPR